MPRNTEFKDPLDEEVNNIDWNKLIKVYMLLNTVAYNRPYIGNHLDNFISYIPQKRALYNLGYALRFIKMYEKEFTEEEKQIIEKIIKLLSE